MARDRVAKGFAVIENDLRRYAGGGAKPVTSGFKLDILRKVRLGRVSSEWFSRPDDERYLSQSALHDAAVLTAAI